MIEDRELDIWREQWSSVAEPPAEFQRKVQQRIKRQDRRFVLDILLTRNRVPRDSDFRRVHAQSIELDGNRLGDGYLRLSIRIGRSSDMGFAANVAF